MKVKKSKSTFINIGFSTIIMVFIMICLVTFATLSVLTAHSDYRLSEKLAEKTTAYYRADATAKDMLKAIDTELFRIYVESENSKEYFEQINKHSFHDIAPTTVFDIVLQDQNDYVTISYKVPVTNVLTLQVTLKMNYPKSGSECFSTIEQWQTVTENEPDVEDDYFHLYTGEE